MAAECEHVKSQLGIKSLERALLEFIVTSPEAVPLRQAVRFIKLGCPRLKLPI